KGLQTTLVIDRTTAARLGITTRTIDQTLYNAFGQAQVSTIYSTLNQYHVVMEVAPQYWQGPEALKSVYVLSPTRGQVPLSAIARYEPTTAPLSVNHQSQFVASTISFNLALGVSLGEAADAINQAMVQLGVPTTVHGSFQGTARAFRQSLDSQPWLILAALVTVYIVLGILYESYIHPVTILSTLPSAGVGALLALMAFRTEFSIIALIGVILLIGLVKKNAIMMIDFAIEAEREGGKSPEAAIFQAYLLRFRPIMMTTIAAMLGAEPHDESNRGNWWEIFGDPQLSALIESINISNQNVRLAEAQFRQAQALAAQSRAALFPTLDANASITRSRSPTGLVGGTTAGRIINNRSVGLSSLWELDLWGGLRRALESSAAGAQASAADLAAARLSAQAELASDYFQLRVLDAQKQLLDDTATAFDKSLELTRNRYTAGVAAKV